MSSSSPSTGSSPSPSPIEVTDALIEGVARLSRLAISGEEAASLCEHFQKILSYVAELQTLDTGDVDPSHFAFDAVNVYREDVSRPSLPVVEALKNAPEQRHPYFAVPRIVGDEEGA